MDEMSHSTTMLRSSGDVDLALHHLGGTGAPLLICHATGFHGRAYLSMAAQLVDHFEIWSMDFRGHGASSAPPSGDFAWAGMADDVQVCVDAVRESTDSPLFAFGHSMGGASILRAELNRPGTFAAAWLFEPIVFSPEIPLPSGRESQMSGAARHRRSVFDSRAAAVERYGSRPPLSGLEPDALAAYVKYGFDDADDGTVTLACAPESEASTFEAPDKLSWDYFTSLDMPCWVARGVVDPQNTPSKFADGIAEAIPTATLVAYDELTHFGPLEDTAGIASAIRAAFSPLIDSPATEASNEQ